MQELRVNNRLQGRRGKKRRGLTRWLARCACFNLFTINYVRLHFEADFPFKSLRLLSMRYDLSLTVVNGS